jgi:hypothetical protein
MGEIEKLQKELTEALDRYKIWCERIDNKQILQRNTEEEIAELDRSIKREIIMPIIAKIKWLELEKE